MWRWEKNRGIKTRDCTAFLKHAAPPQFDKIMPDEFMDKSSIWSSIPSVWTSRLCRPLSLARNSCNPLYIREENLQESLPVKMPHSLRQACLSQSVSRAPTFRHCQDTFSGNRQPRVAEHIASQPGLRFRVTPANARVQKSPRNLDSRFCGNPGRGLNNIGEGRQTRERQIFLLTGFSVRDRVS